MIEPPESRATDQLQLAKSVLGRLSSASQDEIEQALTALNSARSVFTYAHSPIQWAKIAMDQAEIYSRRKHGDRINDFKTAIKYYTEALTVYKWQSHPADWAMCHSLIGELYLRLSDGIGRLYKDLCSVHYEMALATITKESWPEVWHDCHLHLSLLYRKYAMFSENPESPENEDVVLSERHHRMAFDLDRDKDPAFYDMMVRFYDLGTRLFELQLELRHAQGVQGVGPPGGGP